MTLSDPPYLAEFRRQMVELVRAGCMPDELAADYGPPAASIRAWVREAAREEAARRREQRAELKELDRLRTENRRLREELNMLRRAAGRRPTGAAGPRPFADGRGCPRRATYRSPRAFLSALF